MNDNENESIKSIVAEMRHGLDQSWHDIDREWVRGLPDRLDAAWKREREELERYAASKMLDGATIVDNRKVGNAAAMHEAFDEIIEKIEAWRTDGTMEHWQYSQLFDIADAALSAPARNCDLYATATEALKAQDVAFNEDNFKNGECRLGCPGCDDGLIDCKILWLFARAAEEGGAK